MSGCKHKEVHGESETDPDPPVVSRTRSGRRVRPPAALLDSVAPASRTPVRRTRRSVIREDPGESAEPPLETPTADIEPLNEQCTAVADITTAEGNESNPRPVLDDVSLTGPDQTHEKENMVSNAEAGSTGPRPEKRTRSESREKKGKMVPLGKPKSGRVWKDRNKQRFSALLRDKPLRTSWQKKMEAKREKQLVKQYHQQLKDEQAKEKEDKKRRRAENLKRRAENERKAEIVQVIKNTAKIKRMKKKQLRKIEKRDTLSVLQKTPPSVKKGSGKTNSSL